MSGKSERRERKRLDAQNRRLMFADTLRRAGLPFDQALALSTPEIRDRFLGTPGTGLPNAKPRSTKPEPPAIFTDRAYARPTPRTVDGQVKHLLRRPRT